MGSESENENEGEVKSAADAGEENATREDVQNGGQAGGGYELVGVSSRG